MTINSNSKKDTWIPQEIRVLWHEIPKNQIRQTGSTANGTIRMLFTAWTKQDIRLNWKTFPVNIYFPICVLQHFFNFVNDCRTNYLSAYMCVWEFEQLSNRLLWYGVYCNTWGYRIFTINQVAVVQGQLWHDTEIRTQLIRAKLMIVMLFFLNYSEML